MNAAWKRKRDASMKALQSSGLRARAPAGIRNNFGALETWLQQASRGEAGSGRPFSVAQRRVLGAASRVASESAQ
jgi:hypothetical protein